MSKQQIKMSDFSTHLFWDVDIDKLDIIKHKKYIINRVLDYGLINDWLLIDNYYGIQEVGKTAITIRGLDKKSASFIALLANIPIESFLCYTTRQSNPKHWDF